MASRVSLVRLPAFRLLGLSVFCGSVGMVGEQVVLGWLVLSLSDSPIMVGLAYAVRMLPLFLAGLPGGVLADRRDRTRLLQGTNLVMAATMAGLGLLVMTGRVELWEVLLLTFLAGCARAVNQAARQGLTHDVVGADQLMNGVAFLGLGMRAGGLLGSLGVGALIAGIGSGASYVAVAGGYLASAAVLVPMRLGSASRPREPGSAWRSVVDFLELARRDRTVPLLVLLTVGAEVLGFSYQTVLPSLARDVLGVGAVGLGVMTGARSLGGILAIAGVWRLAHLGGIGWLFLAALALFGTGLLALGLAESLVWVLAILVIVDAMAALADVLSQSLIQLAVPAPLRGRAGGVWVVAVGTAPVGQLQIGVLASLYGVGVALVLNGLALVLLAAIGALAFAPVKRL